MVMGNPEVFDFRKGMMMKRKPTSPGEILFEEFLIPLEISQKELAEHLACDYTRSSSKTSKFQSRRPEFESAQRRLRQLNLKSLSVSGGVKVWDAEAEISGSLNWNGYIIFVDF